MVRTSHLDFFLCGACGNVKVHDHGGDGSGYVVVVTVGSGDDRPL